MTRFNDRDCHLKWRDQDDRLSFNPFMHWWNDDYGELVKIIKCTRDKKELSLPSIILWECLFVFC